MFLLEKENDRRGRGEVTRLVQIEPLRPTESRRTAWNLECLCTHVCVCIYTFLESLQPSSGIVTTLSLEKSDAGNLREKEREREEMENGQQHVSSVLQIEPLEVLRESKSFEERSV